MYSPRSTFPYPGSGSNENVNLVIRNDIKFMRMFLGVQHLNFEDVFGSMLHDNTNNSNNYY